MHWRNSRFQVIYFIVGKTHTPDEAYRVLCELKEERELALNGVKAADLRNKAKVLASQKILNNSADEVEILHAQADLAELDANKQNSESCIAEAMRELQFLNTMIARIEPHRKYRDYADYEAHQLAQHDEWRLELLTRAENFLVSSGSIPADHFATMRLHPDWEVSISPRIQELVRMRLENSQICLSVSPVREILGTLSITQETLKPVKQGSI